MLNRLLVPDNVIELSSSVMRLYLLKTFVVLWPLIAMILKYSFPASIKLLIVQWRRLRKIKSIKHYFSEGRLKCFLCVIMRGYLQAKIPLDYVQYSVLRYYRFRDIRIIPTYLLNAVRLILVQSFRGWRQWLGAVLAYGYLVPDIRESGADNTHYSFALDLTGVLWVTPNNRKMQACWGNVVTILLPSILWWQIWGLSWVMGTDLNDHQPEDLRNGKTAA